MSDLTEIHPILDRSPKLRQRADALGWSSPDTTWQGWSAAHRFVCAKGHLFTASPRFVSTSARYCPTCKDDQALQKMKERAAVVGVVCLDDTWRGLNALYRFRCADGHEWTHNALRVNCSVCTAADSEVKRRLKDGLERLIAMATARGGVCLSPSYLGNAARHRFRCAHGHEWDATAGDVLRGSWCRACSNERRGAQSRAHDGLERLQRAAQERGGSCLSHTYRNSSQRYRFRCHQGHEWEATGGHILNGSWCQVCVIEARAARLLLTDGLERLQNLAEERGGVCLGEAYEGIHQRYRFRCAEGHEWTSCGSVIVRGGWCRTCSQERRRLGIETARAAAKARGGQCLSETYRNAASKLTWMCDRGHVWPATLQQIRRGQWCPNCAHMAKITNAASKARAKYRPAGGTVR